MTETEKLAIERSRQQFSETYNALSDAFIKFSLAFDNLTSKLDALNENHPTLFTDC